MTKFDHKMGRRSRTTATTEMAVGAFDFFRRDGLNGTKTSSENGLVRKLEHKT